jgi:hypothetical protein
MAEDTSEFDALKVIDWVEDIRRMTHDHWLGTPTARCVFRGLRTNVH